MMTFPQRLLFSGLLLFLVSGTQLSSAADFSVVERWMATNSGVRTLQIDFTQTRTMVSIAVPIRQPGTLWLNYGANRFRWQTGDPPKTVVVRRDAQLYIIRPGMKKFERRPFGSEAAGPAGMAALAGGFPRSVSEFKRKYRVLSIETVDNTHRVVSQPLGSAGRGVKSFTFVLERNQYRLLGIEIALDDGSRVDTVFTRVRPNVPMPESLFQPPLDGFKEGKF